MLTARAYLQRGAPWQLTAVLLFIARRLLYPPQYYPLVVAVLVVMGLVVFCYCLYVLYVRSHAADTLITHGVFRYTRHPMYTGLVLIDLASWFAPLEAGRLLSGLLFYAALACAAYWQEQETLARFGAAAAGYYRRTPRFFFMYPLLRLRRVRAEVPQRVE